MDDTAAAGRVSSKLMAIVGPGRSGTTWAGTLVDSSPEVIYRFEPFHRLRTVEPEIGQLFQKLRSQQADNDDVPAIYECLRKAHPLTNKAPFFENKSYPVRRFGKKLAWPFARMLPGAASIYRAMYTPPSGPPLVFKEVTFIKPLQNLLQKTRVPVIYVVRHPCATIMSSISVQMNEGIPARVRQLRHTLEVQAPELVARYAEILGGRDLVSQVALLWRYEVETCVRLVQESDLSIVMTYEQLADDAYTQAKAMFGHLGIRFGPSTERYLDSLHELGEGRARQPRRTGWGKRNFSIYRNPREQKDSWKSKIAATDRAKIEGIVQGVPALEYCAALGNWW